MKIVIALVFTFIGFSSFAQTDLDDYKYIIVPKKFDAFKNMNEHQTSTLIKYLFTGKGFVTVYDDQLPEDLKFNRCIGVVADLQDDSSMFSTKTIINLKDCNDKIVFSTMQGISKEKEYKAAYSEAIRESMRSFNGMNYNYTAKEKKDEAVTVNFRNDVKKLDESKAHKVLQVEKAAEEVNVKRAPTVISEETEKTQYYKDNTPVESNIKKTETQKPAFKSLEVKKPSSKDMWYAQATDNGYQLVDSSPKVRMNLLKSSADNVFMAKTDTQNGMVYQKEGNWIFEYYENDKLVLEELNIKF
ncbi:hypothetical protein CLV90_1119 [Maribacter spongiicola]|uniref:Uncharacterized protein n=1 Tax=Maribacter spongiicola TaxID=1206753 RepID=A0A4R7K9C7_9FLAO|nr:hypothetical protein [Maribacter spongiicola]TDT47048.1 hypothetical protein CLV90_1119 [Maribacter spongiicola]